MARGAPPYPTVCIPPGLPAPHPPQSLTPRQVQLLAASGGGGGYEHRASPGAVQSSVCNSGGCGTVREIDPPYMYNSRDASRRERERADW